MPDSKEQAAKRRRKEAARRRLKEQRRREVWYLRTTVLIFLAVLLLLIGVEMFMRIREQGQDVQFWTQTQEEEGKASDTEDAMGARETMAAAAGEKETGAIAGTENAGVREGEQTGGSGDEGISHIRSCSDQWNLILVNPWNAIPNDYQVELEYLSNDQAVDVRCYPMLQQMMDDCRGAGLDPVICSSWRSREKQEALLANKKYRLILAGTPVDEAAAEAAKTVALPGTSEHELGLALDIVDSAYMELETEQEDTPVQQWLMENSWKYGFVLRYPSDKSHLTGIIYEPWHYRYVGTEAAKIMYEEDLCLEEYLEKYET